MEDDVVVADDSFSESEIKGAVCLIRVAFFVFENGVFVFDVVVEPEAFSVSNDSFMELGANSTEVFDSC